MAALKDRVRQTSTSTGTGDIVLSGTIGGFQTFADAYNVGDTFYYAVIDDLNAEWEIGEGELSSSTSFRRNSVYDSTNSGNLVSFGTGQKAVFVTYPAKRALTDTQAIALSVALGG